MTRAQLIALGALDCVFGLVFLFGPDSLHDVARLLNVGLAGVLAVLCGLDLRARGYRLPALAGLLYVAAPLLGLVVYAVLSDRERVPA